MAGLKSVRIYLYNKLTTSVHRLPSVSLSPLPAAFLSFIFLFTHTQQEQTNYIYFHTFFHFLKSKFDSAK
jgi:hypothetical protein